MTQQQIQNGLFGLLIGDALGVPYEFHDAAAIPPFAQIHFQPPPYFPRSWETVPPGTWSDDGAQALCLLDSLCAFGRFDLGDFAARLLCWLEEGLWAVDNAVFDCGNQTMLALRAYAGGTPAEKAGLVLPDGKGNGALMRVLPLALWHRGSDEQLIADAHSQCLITHGHICNQVCCALYCLWARRIAAGLCPEDGYRQAISQLKTHYQGKAGYLRALEEVQEPAPPTGTGYVIDSIRSTRFLLKEYHTYKDVVRGAVALGNDTDTTAAIAGGLAGLACANIPPNWIRALRGREGVEDLLARVK